MNKRYNYDIIVKGHDNKVLANTEVLIRADGRKYHYTTNRKGHLKFNLEHHKVLVSTKHPNKGYYVNADVSGTLNLFIRFKRAIGIKSACSVVTETSPYSGKMELGHTVKMFDKKWIVCHTEDDVYYLVAKKIKDLVTFGPKGTKYADSKLAKAAAKYEDRLNKKYGDIVTQHLTEVTVNGVTSKVFVPSYDQMNKGFHYLNGNKARECKYDGKHDSYWTSSVIASPYVANNNGRVWYITLVGSLLADDPDTKKGFRPCICFKP